MRDRVKNIEKNLQVTLPQDYKDFIETFGVISDERGEIFGYIENIDIEKLPCVIGATKLYKKDYNNILDNEIVISFDDMKNMPIILNTENGNIYNINYQEKNKINSSFQEWLDSTLKVL